MSAAAVASRKVSVVVPASAKAGTPIKAEDAPVAPTAGHDECTAAITKLKERIIAIEAKEKSQREKHNAQRDKLDEQLSKMSNELRDTNTAALMERVQFQKEKEALERRIIAGMKKADGIQEQLNEMTRSRDQVLSQKAELSQAILKANGTIEQKDKDITVLQLSLNSAQREIDNFEDKLAAALAKADERRIFETDLVKKQMADADKLWGSRLDECELKLEASRNECRQLDLDLQTEQANLRAERTVTASLRDDLEKLQANHNTALKALADTEMGLQSAKITVSTLESSLEQAKAQFSADKDALKEEMKKLNEDWTRRFQALQAKHETASTDLAKQKTTVTTLTVLRDRLMEQKEELRVSLVNTEAALATAANTLKGKEFEQSQDRLKMQKLTQDLAKANQALEDAKVYGSKLKAANDAANKQIALLQETIEKDKAALSAARTQHSVLESSIKDLNTQLSTAQNAADNVRLEWQLDSSQRESQLKEVETKRAAAVKETKKLSKDNGNLQRQVAALTQEKTELGSTVSRVSKQLKSCEQELKLTKDALKTAEAAVTAGDARVASITEELQKWKRTAQAAATESSGGYRHTDSTTSLSRPKSNPTGEFNSAVLPSASMMGSVSKSLNADVQWGPQGAVAKYRNQVASLEERVVELRGNVDALSARLLMEQRHVESLKTEMDTQAKEAAKNRGELQQEFEEFRRASEAKYTADMSNASMKIRALQGEVKVMTTIMTEDKKEAVREAMRNLDSESVSLLKHLVEVQNGLDDRMGRFRHKLNVLIRHASKTKKALADKAANDETVSNCARCTRSLEALKAAREKNVNLATQLATAKQQSQSLGRMLAGAASGIPAPDLMQNVNKLRKQLQAVTFVSRARETFSRDGSRPGTQGSALTEASTESHQKPARLPVSPYTVPVRMRPDTPPPPQPPVYDDGLLHLLTGPHPAEHHTLPSLTGVAPSQSRSHLQDSLLLNDTTVQTPRATVAVVPSLLDSEGLDDRSSSLMYPVGFEGSTIMGDIEFQASSRASEDW